MKYQVSGIEPKQYSKNEIAGGDSYKLRCFSQRFKAFEYAKTQSKNAVWYEVEVRQHDKDNELQGHWYFQNGKMTFDMSV